MKKLILLIALLFIFPFVSIAQERSLYEISKESLEICDLAVHYMHGDIPYTEEDLRIFKEAADRDIKDLLSLVRTHDLNRMALTADQAVELKASATGVYNKLITVKVNNCDRANNLLTYGYLIFLMGLVLTLSIGGAIFGIPLVIVGIIVMLLGGIAFIFC
jgi:hypothetical protein